jgi:hypothetical protein
MKRTYALLLALLTPALPAAAQSGAGAWDGPDAPACASHLRLAQGALNDDHADFARAAELTGLAPIRSRLIRRISDERPLVACAERITTAWGTAPGSGVRRWSPSVELLPVAWSSHFNSAYPRDRNNGALWAGRGLSTELRGGVEMRWGPLSAAFAPTIAYQQNRAFEIMDNPWAEGYSPYLYPGWPTTIDWPQRFGDRPFWTLDPGQSYVRLDAFSLALGISNENLWWGPARRNPILMSNTAPGFQHLFLGTSRPVNVGIGKFEAEAIWGRLEGSEHFYLNSWDDRQLLAGLVFDFEPRGVPGLFLGGARVYLRDLPVGGLPLSTWLLGPYRGVSDNPQGYDNPEGDNQLISAFVRWAPPRASFEAYLEWAREDHWADLDELIAVPDASQGFTLGFQKVVPRGERWLRIAGEATQLADPLPTIWRWNVPFYAHHQLQRGYTHRGRLLGAAIGPNANAQYLGVDLFTPAGRRGLFVERTRYNVDANGGLWTRKYGAEGADVEWTIGLHQHLFLRRFDLGWSLAHSYRRNRNYLGLYRSSPEFITERNWNLRFDLAWRPGARAQAGAPRTTAPVTEGRR